MRKNLPTILHGHVTAPTAIEAVVKFHEAVAQPDAALVIFFCSSHYDLAVVSKEIRQRFGETPVVGCTTAGEMGVLGYTVGSISGVSLPASHFAAASRCIPALDTFSFSDGHTVVQELLRELDEKKYPGKADSVFAFLMVDGISVHEEPVTRVIQSALGKIPLIGGSAGDGLDFASTPVYANGRFNNHSAVLTLVRTSHRFEPFITQHFSSTEDRVVVTAADPTRRLVFELDGKPAAEVYAELLGLKQDELDAKHFATAPLAVVIGGTNYVRSISEALPDGSLKFFCAIEEGLVLRMVRGNDLLENLDNTFSSLRARIGVPMLILGCNCILRRIEIEQKGLTGSVGELMKLNRVCGFNSYGEQFRGIHINQTFTGIAIGSDGGNNDE